MLAADPCPLCEPGRLVALLGDWLRCTTCRTAYDNHGQAYDSAMWTQLTWRQA